MSIRGTTAYCGFEKDYQASIFQRRPPEETFRERREAPQQALRQQKGKKPCFSKKSVFFALSENTPFEAVAGISE